MSATRFPQPTALAFGAALALALVGCGGDAATGDLPTESEHHEFQVNVVVDSGSFHRGANDFEVAATDATGQPAQLVSVVALMPEHGHYADAPTIVPSASGYTVTDLVLPMAGSWQITLNFATTTLHDDALVVTFVP